MAKSFSNADANDLIERAYFLSHSIAQQQSIAEEFDARFSAAVNEARMSKARSILAKIKVKRSGNEKAYSPASDSAYDGEALSKVADSQNMDTLVKDEDGHTCSLADCVERALECSRIQLDSASSKADSSSILIAALAKERAALLEQRRQELAARLQKEIPRLVSGIQCGTGTLSWLFSSRDEKACAEESYRQLKDLLEGDPARELEDIFEQRQALEVIDSKEARAWYTANREHVEGLIEEACPGFLGPDEWTLDAVDAHRAYKRASADFKRFRAHKESTVGLERKIATIVRRAVAQKALKELKKIPVEELNRGKLGIRVKVLEDGGYKTVADVYGATERELSLLSGITRAGAKAIKEQANLIAKDVQEGIKLRLSVEDKSAASTKIVRAVYSVQKWKDLHAEWELLADEVDRAPMAFLTDLEPATKRIVWLFASEETHDRAADAYECALQFCESKLAADVARLMDRLDADKKFEVDSEEAWAYFEANPVETFSLIEKVCPEALSKTDAFFGLPEELAREVQEQVFFPDGLKCTLRRYQEMGVKYILHQERTLLGDEMGLGKTIQAIAAMVSLKNAGESHFVVVCPASVLENWCREIIKHSRLHVFKVHGPDSVKSFGAWRRAGGVAVTTYETTKKLRLPEGFAFGLAVVDEAHYIKNPEAARTANTLRLIAKARRVVLMTGTALENRVDEMLTLVGYLRPQVAQSAGRMAYKTSARMFRAALAPVYHRRKREDVLSELPDLIESEEWCTLSAVEEEAYARACLKRSIMSARRVSWNVENLKKDSSKAKRLLELVADAKDDGRKVLVFTFFLDTASSVAGLLGKKCVGTITGKLSPKKRQDMVEKFDAAPAGSVLVSQIQAGGTGMNIQSASMVVFCEPQYKPSIENQAVSRAYRMGQTRSVLAFKLLCEESVDERIQEILGEKKEAFDAFADKSAAAAADAADAVAVDAKRVGKIIEEEIERIKAKNPELAARIEREMAEEAEPREA